MNVPLGGYQVIFKALVFFRESSANVLESDELRMVRTGHRFPAEPSAIRFHFAGLRHQFSDHQLPHRADVQTQTGGLCHSFHGRNRQGDQRNEAVSQRQGSHRRRGVPQKRKSSRYSPRSGV